MPQISPQSLIHAAAHGQAPPRGAARGQARGQAREWVRHYVGLGIAREVDVAVLDATLSAQMDAANVAVLGCPRLPASDAAQWSGIYKAWLALRADWLAFKKTQDAIGPADLFGQLTADVVDSTYLDKMRAAIYGRTYAQWAADVQAKVAASEGGQVSPEPAATSSFAAAALIVVGAGVLAASLAWLAPLVLGAAAVGARRRPRS